MAEDENRDSSGTPPEGTLSQEGSDHSAGEAFAALHSLARYLRGERGCPWDRQQTLESIRPFIIEEAYEVIEAIDSEDQERVQEELGDLLYLVLFCGQLAKENGHFTTEEVLRAAFGKLVSRHPHVFRGEHAGDPTQALEAWERVKARERLKEGEKSVLDGIPRHLPGLIRAQRTQQRAASVGFEWDEASDVLAKVKEEAEELHKAHKSGDRDRVQDEMGDLFFSLVNLCRFLDVSAEDSLQAAVERFRSRFRKVEESIEKGERKLTLAEMDEIWEEAKRDERAGEDETGSQGEL